jgi:aryl-alcohol dehydrogenase-like predicted oxidoreductase
MKKQIFHPTNLETSRLGFGCIQLTAQRSRREALSVLEQVYSLGITHFDVARAYGFGRTEGILGEFLRHKRHEVTVTTKFGIQPPSGVAGNIRAINVLKKILRPFPGLLRQAKNHGSAMVKAGIFTPEAAVRSLETSLRELGTDYVDLFLLHEATVADSNRDCLVATLLNQVKKGRIRHLGLGSAFPKLQDEASLLPADYEVLQFNDNAVDRNVSKLTDCDRRLVITHSALAPARLLRQAIEVNPQIAREHSLRMNIDLAEPTAISLLLLRFSLWSNATGIVLFSSKDPQHIAANVRVADSEPLDDVAARQFVEFVEQLLASTNLNPGGPS